MVTPTYTFADGLTVNRLGYGAMRLTGQPGNFGRYPDWDEGKRVLRRAVERGVQHIDTARAYGPGWNEELVAEALHPYPSDLLIATKGGIEKNAPAPAGSWLDGSPSALRTHVDESLQRLKLDTIGLYYLHRPDPQVDIAESVGALAELQRAGKIRHIGVSNVSVEQLAAARSVATVAAVQNRFDPINGGDTDVLDVVAAAGIAFVPWGPLGTDPFERVAPVASEDAVAGEPNATPVQRALHALLRRSDVVLPIPGTTSIEHLDENLDALRTLPSES